MFLTEEVEMEVIIIVVVIIIRETGGLWLISCINEGHPVTFNLLLYFGKT